MLKRIILISLAAAALLIIAGGYYYLRRTLVTGTDPVNAVAVDAVAVIRTENLEGLISGIKSDSLFWSEIGTVLNSPEPLRGLNFLDSLLSARQSVAGLLANRTLWFSLHPTGRDSYGTVFYSSLSSVREIKLYNELMREMLAGHAMISERVYERVKVHDAVFHRGGDISNLSWTISDGVFILSFSPFLIENAVRQLDDPDNLLADESFRRLYATRGSNVDANISVNLGKLPGYISSFLRDEPKRFMDEFTDLSEWAEMDLHLRENAFLVNGFSFSGGEGNNYLDLFAGQSPIRLEAESVIPSGSSAFLGIGLSDVTAFLAGYHNWLDNTGRRAAHMEMTEEFRRLTGADPAEAFPAFMAGEVALILSGREEPGKKGGSFLLVKTVSRSVASGILNDMLSHHSRLTGRNINSYRQVYRIDRETTREIHTFPYGRTGEILFGKVFGAAETAYYTFVGNYLVFGNSFDGLSEFVHANILNQTLSNDLRFREFSEFLASGNNLWLYSNVARSAGLFHEVLNEELGANLSVNLESFRKFQALSLQFSSAGDMIYNNLFLKYSPQIVEEPHTEWQTLLDTIIDFKPLLLLNHNTGENEIFVQDLKNNIYLINRAGRILWKKPLPGRIMGTVYQIDYFSNNRLQMLFNTRDQIFLLDRNGNDVGRYPIRLPSPATNGISVFDYENNKDYRIFVACEDKSVVVRSGDGNIISGWNFRGTEHPVTREIKYFRVDGRDYIVFADLHRVYILDRRGNTRVSPQQLFPVSPRNNIVMEARSPGSGARLVITDVQGNVWYIGFDGRTETRKLGDYTEDHFFDLQDVNADGYNDHIFLDNDRLDVYRRDGTLMFSRQFPLRITHAPAYYYFSRHDRKLGVVSRDAGRIFLINSNGEMYEGFPLAGKSYFTIGFLQSGYGNFHLIVGSDHNLLYNYIVY